jgi:hypothetical protein
MNKVKQFFSPIQGGHLHGYTFGKFFKSTQRWIPPVVNIVFMLIPAYHLKETSLGAFIAVEVFLFSILCIWAYKTLQHWNDLKNHKSR